MYAMQAARRCETGPYVHAPHQVYGLGIRLLVSLPRNKAMYDLVPSAGPMWSSGHDYNKTRPEPDLQVGIRELAVIGGLVE
jgi:hypothetical protein